LDRGKAQAYFCQFLTGAAKAVAGACGVGGQHRAGQDIAERIVGEGVLWAVAGAGVGTGGVGGELTSFESITYMYYSPHA